MFVPLQDKNPLQKIQFQWVTISIIIINVIVWLGVVAAPNDRVAASFALVPFELFKVKILGGSAHGPLDGWAVPEGWTLLSYMFLHGDFLHILGNMLFLWVFGDNVEDAMGHGRYLLFYILCGVAGGMAHALAVPGSTIPLIGASGAVAGVVAAYVLLYPRVNVWVLFLRVIPLNVTAAFCLGLWIITQVVMAFLPQTGPVAWWAHVGGICAGAVLVLFLRRPGVELFQKTPAEPPPAGPTA